jgi:hypothetical protein
VYVVSVSTRSTFTTAPVKVVIAPALTISVDATSFSPLVTKAS